MNNTFKLLTILIILSLIFIGYYIYRTRTFVTAEFKNLRPFHDRAPIYYNGYRIGSVVRVRPNKTYTTTLVTLMLHPQDLRLPINVTANLKKEKNKKNDKFDYIDLVYPEQPSMYFLKDGDKIAGKSSVELDTYLSNQDPDSLDAIKQDFAESAKNLNITIQSLGDLFQTLNSMAVDIKPNVVDASLDLKNSTSNLVRISENVETVTGSVDNAFNKKRLDSTAANMHAVSKNVKVLTSEVNKTIPQIGCTIQEVNQILCNVEEITCGVSKTMQKPFGGLRLLFGRPMAKK